MKNKVLPIEVKVSEHVLFQKINDECVLLNMENEQYFGLDIIGARIWEIIADNGNVSQALARLQQEYDVDLETLKLDLAQLLSEFESEKLIVIER